MTKSRLKIVNLMTILGLAFLTSYCSKSDSDSSGGYKSESPRIDIDNTDNGTSSDAEKDQDGGDNKGVTDGESSGSNEPVEEISEARARSIMQGSCMAANCHTDVGDIFDSADMVRQLEDNLMPPPDQSRYTLSDKRRAELVLFFKNRGNTN